MAYAADQNQDPNEEKATAQAPANQPPTTGGSVGEAGGGKSSNQPSSATAPAPFTNLQSYLNVNAPQIQGTADKVAGQLTNQYGQVQGDINKAGQDFGAQVNAGYTAPNQNVVDQAVKDPTAFAKDPNNVQAFQKQLNNAYKGPASFSTTPEYGTVQGEAQNAVNQAQNLGTYSGLQQYLTSNVEQNPTQAMSALDTALLNQSPGAIQTVQNAAKPLSSIGDYLNTVKGQQDTNVSNAQTAAQQAAQYAKSQGDTAINTLKTGVAGRTADAQKKAQATVDSLTNAFANNKGLSDDQLHQLGMSKDQYNQLQNGSITLQSLLKQKAGTSGMMGTADMPTPNLSDLKQYLTTQNPSALISNANTATGDEYQRAAALSQITGQDLSSFLNPATQGQAGTAPTNFAKFNFQDALQNYLNQINGLKPKDAPMTSISSSEPNTFQKAVNGVNTIFPMIDPAGVGSKAVEGLKDAGKSVIKKIKHFF